jgi:PPK2 family polyphosphate:nucleotide phosphotransferase
MKKSDIETLASCGKKGTDIALNKIDPSIVPQGITKKKSTEILLSYQKEISILQTKLFAEQKQSLLCIFQAMDTGGKDGAIRNLFTGINPAGVNITSFKAPTTEDSKFDYMKRIHESVPAKGIIGVWNRSHYEDVLIVRVHGMIDKKTCFDRYEQINNFEKMLSKNGTTILKFFLHISKEEQKKRLQERLDDPEKQWKFDPADLSERKLWNAYTKAYEDVINVTSTPCAPWFVIPSDHKWVRNLLISNIVLDTLKKMAPAYPKAKFEKGTINIE